MQCKKKLRSPKDGFLRKNMIQGLILLVSPNLDLITEFSACRNKREKESELPAGFTREHDFRCFPNLPYGVWINIFKIFPWCKQIRRNLICNKKTVRVFSVDELPSNSRAVAGIDWFTSFAGCKTDETPARAVGADDSWSCWAVCLMLGNEIERAQGGKSLFFLCNRRANLQVSAVGNVLSVSLSKEVLCVLYSQLHKKINSHSLDENGFSLRKPRGSSHQMWRQLIDANVSNSAAEFPAEFHKKLPSELLFFRLCLLKRVWCCA